MIIDHSNLIQVLKQVNNLKTTLKTTIDKQSRIKNTVSDIS